MSDSTNAQNAENTTQVIDNLDPSGQNDPDTNQSLVGTQLELSTAARLTTSSLQFSMAGTNEGGGDGSNPLLPASFEAGISMTAQKKTL